jgi:hypothetical protein
MTKQTIADFPLPLRSRLQVEDGYVSFCYPYEVGALHSQINHIDDELRIAMLRRGKERLAALKRVADMVTQYRADYQLISRQWGEELERRRQARSCAKCGKERYDHKHVANPAAGDCEYEPKTAETAQ